MQQFIPAATELKLSIGIAGTSLLGVLSTVLPKDMQGWLVQGGAIAILGMSAWFTLTKLAPRWLEYVFKTMEREHAAHVDQVNALRLSNDRLHEELATMAKGIAEQATAAREQTRVLRDMQSGQQEVLKAIERQSKS